MNHLPIKIIYESSCTDVETYEGTAEEWVENEFPKIQKRHNRLSILSIEPSDDLFHSKIVIVVKDPIYIG